MTDPKTQAAYIDCRNSFDTSLVRYIPKKIPNNMISVGYASLDNDDYAGIHLTTKIQNEDKYSETKEKFSKQAKYILNSVDNCIMIIETYGKLKENKIDFSGCKTPIPVPQFGICVYNDSTHIWERSTNEKIMMLDFNFADILTKDDLKKKNDLPIEFRKGYSTGITLNDKDLTIQYWLIVW